MLSAAIQTQNDKYCMISVIRDTAVERGLCWMKIYVIKRWAILREKADEEGKGQCRWTVGDK